MIHYRTESLTVFRSGLYQTTSTVLHTPDLARRRSLLVGRGSV